jgi:hypothetical protein
MCTEWDEDLLLRQLGFLRLHATREMEEEETLAIETSKTRPL